MTIQVKFILDQVNISICQYYSCNTENHINYLCKHITDHVQPPISPSFMYNKVYCYNLCNT